MKVDAAWNAPTGEALQALAPQGAREAVCGEGGRRSARVLNRACIKPDATGDCLYF